MRDNLIYIGEGGEEEKKSIPRMRRKERTGPTEIGRTAEVRYGPVE